MPYIGFLRVRSVCGVSTAIAVAVLVSSHSQSRGSAVKPCPADALCSTLAGRYVLGRHTGVGSHRATAVLLYTVASVF